MKTIAILMLLLFASSTAYALYQDTENDFYKNQNERLEYQERLREKYSRF